MKHLLLVIISLAMFGCATNPGGYKTEEAAEQKLMGMSEEEVAINLGAPTEQVKMSNGSAAWTYRDEVKGLTGGKCTVSIVLKNGKVLKASVTAKDRSWVSFPLGSCENLLGNLK